MFVIKKYTIGLFSCIYFIFLHSVYLNVWKREIFEELDLVLSEVKRRFDQVRIQVAAGQEQAIIEAAQGKKVNVTSLKLTGFTRERLSHELDILRDICTGREVNTIRDVVSILQTMQLLACS